MNEITINYVTFIGQESLTAYLERSKTPDDLPNDCADITTEVDGATFIIEDVGDICWEFKRLLLARPSVKNATDKNTQDWNDYRSFCKIASCVSRVTAEKTVYLKGIDRFISEEAVEAFVGCINTVLSVNQVHLVVSTLEQWHRMLCAQSKKSQTPDDTIYFLNIAVHNWRKNPYEVAFLKSKYSTCPGFLDLSEQVRKERNFDTPLRVYETREMNTFKRLLSQPDAVKAFPDGVPLKHITICEHIANVLYDSSENGCQNAWIDNINELVPSKLARVFLIHIQRLAFRQAIAVFFTVSDTWQPLYEFK